MTKVTTDSNKVRKSKSEIELKAAANDEKAAVLDTKVTAKEVTTKNGAEDEVQEYGSCEDEESGSCVTTDEETADGKGSSSGEDTDQLMARALDTVYHQATESKIVIPPVVSEGPETEPVKGQASLDMTIAPLEEQFDQKETGDESSLPATPPKVRTIKRKVEEGKRKVRKTGRERKEKLRLQVVKQVTTLAAACDEARVRDTALTPSQKIPRLPSPRSRQRKAVEQARKCSGLSSKYSNLANLVEFHRILLKGNPFALIEPKQVYPHFHLIPGIYSAQMKPLIRAWQEKATRILYQLLLVETKGDIARIKRRTAYFNATPALFADALALKIDIGLEIETPVAPDGPGPSTQARSKPTPGVVQAPPKPPTNHGGQPPPKKTKKAV